MSDHDSRSEPRRDLVGLEPRRAGRGDGRVRRRAVPRAPALALDLSSRRHRLRRHDQSGQGLSRAARRALRAAAGRRSRGALASVDGTRKWLLRFADGQEVETVHIPEEGRGTLCVSSQVGCTLNCTFCHTGTQRLVRNLGAAEIVGQIMVARDALGEWPSPPEGRQLTNIVLMGMGEPLYNYENVAAAMKIVMDPEGLAVSRRKITLSTAGVVPMLGACRRRARGQPRGVAACRQRRIARPPGAAQPEIPASRAARRLPPLSRVEQCPAHHLRIRHAEGRQRQPGRSAASWCGCSKAFPPRSI